MHSMSFGAEDENIVKNLLRQVYSAHLTKVKSLEAELKELKAQLLQIGKSEKSECNRCKEVQQTLNSCKQEYRAALDKQRKEYECLAQKLILLESKSVSFHGNVTLSEDVADKGEDMCLESSQEKQVLTNISTNVASHEQNLMNSKPDFTEISEASNEGSHSVRADIGLALYSSLSPKKKTDVTPVNQKDFFSTLQSSFLDISNDTDIVLVTETLDVLDEVPNKDTSQKKTSKKENKAPKGKSSQTTSHVDEGKENVSESTKSSSDRRLGKRCNTTNSSESQKNKKPCKTVGPKEALTENSKSHGEKVLCQVDPLCAKTKESSSNAVKADDTRSTSKVEDFSHFSIGSTFFNVNPSFLEDKSETALNNSKKSKSQSPPKKSKTRNPAIEITHDDDDFQTSLNTVSKKDDESGAWKMAKKNIKKTSNISSIKTTTRYKMTLEAPSLNFRKPKYKQTKLSKSIFQPSHTPTTDSIILSENDSVVQSHANVTKSNVKEDNSKNRVKEDSDCKVKDDDSNKVKDRSNSGFNEVSGKVKDYDKNREKQKEFDETIIWEEGTFSNSGMEIVRGESFSSSEIEKVKNVTLDVDATFVPYHMLQNSNDSVPGVTGTMNETESLLVQKGECMNTSDHDENSSSDFVKDGCRRKALHEEICANHCFAYSIKQYPEKNSAKPPPSKTEKQKCNSFDRVPSPELPSYKFKEEPVRTKDKRQQLQGFECKECERYYSALGLTDEQKKDRLKQCSRHRATYVPPATPANFWELDFPDTQECKERGYVGDTQKVVLKSRRRRPLK